MKREVRGSNPVSDSRVFSLSFAHDICLLPHLSHNLDFKTATIIKGTQSISILLVACIIRRFQNQPDVACKRGLIIAFEPIPELLEEACKRGLIIVFEPIPELLEEACKRGLIIVFEPIPESTGCSL